MNEKNTEKLKGYVLIGQKYVAKKYLLLALGLVLVFPVFIDQVILPLYDTYFKDHTLYVDSEELAGFSGEGKIYSAEKELLYVGAVEEGIYQGQGRLYSPSGTLLYEGEFEKGKYQGTGVLYDKEGKRTYEGEFLQGEFLGQGKLYGSNGNLMYEGAFAENMKSGQGKLYGKRGALSYEGLMKADEIDYVAWLGAAHEDVKAGFKAREYTSMAALRMSPDIVSMSSIIYDVSTFADMNMAMAFGAEGSEAAGLVEMIFLWGGQKAEDAVFSWWSDEVLILSTEDVKGGK